MAPSFFLREEISRNRPTKEDESWMRGRVVFFLLIELGAFLVIGTIGLVLIHKLTVVDSQHVVRIDISESKNILSGPYLDLSEKHKNLAPVYPKAHYDRETHIPTEQMPLHRQHALRRHSGSALCATTRTDPSFHLCRWPTRKVSITKFQFSCHFNVPSRTNTLAEP